MAEIAPTPDAFDFEVETLIVGGGACGMVAALSAHEAGQEVLVVEADPVPQGSTALSAGLIPAAGTSFQTAAGIADDPAFFAADIQKKAKGENDPALVDALARGAAPAIDWLAERFDLPFSVVTDFDYPGHSRRRMHGLPSRAGRELIDRLRATVEAQEIMVICERRATVLHHDARRITGVTLTRPDGATETVGCAKLILACNGFGGNRAMVTEHMPEIDSAVWFGHDGNRGEAVEWGAALGAATRHLGAYQGHGNVAHPHGILITWAVIGEGGVQVNRDGARFWDESQGYSEAARAVLGQPGGEAFSIFDARIAGIARQFEDFRNAEAQGAVKTAETLGGLAEALGLPAEALAQTLAAIPSEGEDAFGRSWAGQRLGPPFCGVRVTGALFHTQGGLETDGTGRVIGKDGAPFPNLFAAGGAACGVSGSGDSGYLSGNGLLAAVVLGRAAGAAAV
ncbi:Fumarate reductase flavoprotein subunit precursor [Roseivivax sp. THAF40]|uniref:FAD-dependent oxidoreductase n=1 Tax=unclassified Roseivivax TaxID=2639302 RepID=UPI0012697DEA|nr:MULTISPECIES: FAD-dependent oxidoreductase [unclassified Roseivivax]QFS81826.1 Fumarate reductase flavoprotein subunit precursor [Roseivivax sp. THAF197b]QFT45626.1 Fumarate reductase flavoprotein subunit precursor [Roseivivax sp. THAF40]